MFRVQTTRSTINDHFDEVNFDYKNWSFFTKEKTRSCKKPWFSLSIVLCVEFCTHVCTWRYNNSFSIYRLSSILFCTLILLETCFLLAWPRKCFHIMNIFYFTDISVFFSFFFIFLKLTVMMVTISKWLSSTVYVE